MGESGKVLWVENAGGGCRRGFGRSISWVIGGGLELSLGLLWRVYRGFAFVGNGMGLVGAEIFTT